MPTLNNCLLYNQKQEEEIRVSLKKTGYNCHQVHTHLNQIENMLNSIKFNSPPVLNIDICLICMQKILININNLLNLIVNNYSTFTLLKSKELAAVFFIFLTL